MPGARSQSLALHSYLYLLEHRGMYLYLPRYTVIQLATGEQVAMRHIFAKLSSEELEIMTNTSPMMTLSGYLFAAIPCRWFAYVLLGVRQFGKWSGTA